MPTFCVSRSVGQILDLLDKIDLPNILFVLCFCQTKVDLVQHIHFVRAKVYLLTEYWENQVWNDS